VSHLKPLELFQQADFSWQRREPVLVCLKGRLFGKTKIHQPQLPHGEPLETCQQTELAWKRSEVVALDLAAACLVVRSRTNRFANRTQSSSSAVSCAISLGSEQRLFLPSQSFVMFFKRNNSAPPSDPCPTAEDDA
jgi:hypothetical protein